MEIRKQMIVLEDKIDLGKVVFDDNNRNRISCYCLGQTCPNIFSFCWSSLGAFGEFTFKNFWRKTLWVGFLCSAARYFLPSPRLWTQYFLHKTESSFFWVVLPKLENRSFFTNGWKLEHFNQSLTNFTFFYQHSHPLYVVMQEENGNLEFMQGVKFWIYWIVKKQLYKVLVTFWRFLWKDL